MTEAQALSRASAKSASIIKTASGLIPASTTAIDVLQTLPVPVLVKASGATVTDVDGNDYADFVCGHGSLLLGHGDDRIVAAISKAAAKGCALGATTETRVRLAELIAARIPSIDMIQYAPSRYHVVREVARLVRRRTGQSWIVIPDGSMSRRALIDDERVVRVDRKIDALDAATTKFDTPPAAVIVEPVGTDGGLHIPTGAYLESLRSWCDKHGALLVFDEAVTAFRLAPGGASTYFNVHPDITCFGTSVTGGMGVAAYGGRRDLMQEANADACVHISLSEVGDEPSFAAGVAFLQATTEDAFHESLDQQAAALLKAIERLDAKPQATVSVQRIGSIVGIEVTPRSQSVSPSPDSEVASKSFYTTMLDHGVLVTPELSSCLYLSAAHRDEHVTRAATALDHALTAVHDRLS